MIFLRNDVFMFRQDLIGARLKRSPVCYRATGNEMHRARERVCARVSAQEQGLGSKRPGDWTERQCAARRRSKTVICSSDRQKEGITGKTISDL